MSYPPPPAGAAREAFAERAFVSSAKLAWWQRWLLTAAGIVLLGLLFTAARLTPNPRGIGTHQQLGLPPCTVAQWYGIRCPSCGMTTSWAHLTRLNLVAAVRANAGGTLLALAACLCGPWFVASGALGRWLGGVPQENWTLAAGLTIVAVTIIDWTLRLSLGW
jgi:hypothetical protein